MSNETKIVRGGFRATLALIISVIALIIAMSAYNRIGGEEDLRSQIRDLKEKVTTLKKETSEKVTKVRQETAEALMKIGVEIKKEGVKKEEEKPEESPEKATSPGQ